ncbi:hypothetical protein ABR737_40585 [Streptomyces sp. Edi2]|uniref:hypothetical protein n=1 Tax=Streptomyces sp. Edi2 TaxID=3162528 RepID=UPI003305684F
MPRVGQAEADEQPCLRLGEPVAVVGAYGPDWCTTMREVRHRLEQPYVKCTVDGDASGLGDHEVLVRWATPEEAQARKRAQAQRQVPLVALLRKQDAAAKAAAERQTLEDAGQAGLW